MASIICLLAAVVSRESGVATGAVLLLLEAYTECLPGKRKQEEGRVVVVDGPTILVEAVDPRTVPVAGLKEAPKPGKASKLGSMDLLGAILGEASREPLAEGTGRQLLGGSRHYQRPEREANVEAMATVEEINKARSRTVRRRPAP